MAKIIYTYDRENDEFKTYGAEGLEVTGSLIFAKVDSTKTEYGSSWLLDLGGTTIDPDESSLYILKQADSEGVYNFYQWVVSEGKYVPLGTEGPEGPQGPVGETGNMWRPSVDIDGNLSWTMDSGSIPPTSLSIKGPQGIPGPKGDTGSIEGLETITNNDINTLFED